MIILTVTWIALHPLGSSIINIKKKEGGEARYQHSTAIAVLIAIYKTLGAKSFSSKLLIFGF